MLIIRKQKKIMKVLTLTNEGHFGLMAKVRTKYTAIVNN